MNLPLTFSCHALAQNLYAPIFLLTINLNYTESRTLCQHGPSTVHHYIQRNARHKAMVMPARVVFVSYCQ